MTKKASLPPTTWRQRLEIRALPLIVRLEGTTWEGKILGLRCRLRRHKRGQHWCGFVEVPSYHKLHGKGLGECTRIPQCLPREVSSEIGALIGASGKLWDCPHMLNAMGKKVAHGGITFAGKMKGEEGWWLGIDFGHIGDLSPRTTEVLGKIVGGMPPYRTKQYAKTELAKLARWVKNSSANA